jgi:hypothetical protein
VDEGAKNAASPKQRRVAGSRFEIMFVHEALFFAPRYTVSRRTNL